MDQILVRPALRILISIPVLRVSEESLCQPRSPSFFGSSANLHPPRIVCASIPTFLLTTSQFLSPQPHEILRRAQSYFNRNATTLSLAQFAVQLPSGHYANRIMVCAHFGSTSPRLLLLLSHDKIRGYPWGGIQSLCTTQPSASKGLT